MNSTHHVSRPETAQPDVCPSLRSETGVQPYYLRRDFRFSKSIGDCKGEHEELKKQARLLASFRDILELPFLFFSVLLHLRSNQSIMNLGNDSLERRLKQNVLNL